MNNLVIVESPAKAKTIEKFLGKDYTVKSSFGHVRDLVKKGLGVDVEHGFAPTYEVDPEKRKLVAELSKLAKDAKTVWLASDEDREGEAIAWHLSQVLELDGDRTRRIVFHEITKNAILAAIENPRSVDMNLVDAQQARRILDRLVGFELSPILWRKVKPNLSAGRVQSVAVRLIVEREREIMGFETATWYRVVARFVSGATIFGAELNRRFATRDEAQAFLERCIGAGFRVDAVERKPGHRHPAPPFTTSTLQQEAARKFGMSVSQTMSVAQKLYENGFITYMRTDSVNLSQQAIGASKQVITESFGAEYSNPRTYKTHTKGAQEAHEAIRPTYLQNSTVEGTPAEKKLYDLIRKRTLASQMAAADIEKTSVVITIDGAAEHFQAVGEVVLFDGFLRLYSESTDDEAEEQGGERLPEMKRGDTLEAVNITATQRFASPPPRYGEAMLVKRLEELGIGRPSTYAPTISTIVNRGYVVRQNKEGVRREYVQLTLEKEKITDKMLSETAGRERNKLAPTDIGMLVNDYLESQFREILDYNFTATVETQFDEIAEGDKEWRAMIGDFYGPFHRSVQKALETTGHVDTHQSRVLGSDPATGREVSARIGRYGPIVQIEGAEGEKPRYASLKKGQLIASITLAEALDLFSLPRTVGEIDGKEVVVGIGKFGPYVRYDGKFTSLAKTDDPYTIGLDRARQLIEEKAEKATAARTPLKVFPEKPGLQILNGRYGPYIAFEGKNYPIPRSADPLALSLDEVLELIEKKKQKK